MNTSRMAFVFLLVLMIFQAAYYYPQMPEKMASHFGIAGNADGWMPKTAFFVFEFVVSGVLALMFLLLPMSIVKLPAASINLPHKDYWLDPLRRSDTEAYIQAAMLWQGNATLLLLLIVFQMVMETNLNHSEQLPMVTMLSAIGGFIVFNVLWSVVFIRKFLVKG